MGNNSPQTPSKDQLRTGSGKRTQQILMKIWEPLDVLGQGLMGDMWRTFYLSIQDAIALSLILKMPSLVSHIIIGKDFSSLESCWQENALGISRYACFIIITSDFCLWIVLAGRIIGRFRSDIWELRRKDRNGSSKP
ncbi:MAG: hypothetical protein QNJ47_13425 [Nostocaceae cyanobacterium]|nr:hypothetical protein [Nostocaceae cyanobacterium]